MYHVIQYDVMSMEKNAMYGKVVDKKTGKKVMDATPPTIITTFTTLDEATERINKMNEDAKTGEQINNITLKNGGIYSGPRYIYRMGVDPS